MDRVYRLASCWVCDAEILGTNSSCASWLKSLPFTGPSFPSVKRRCWVYGRKIWPALNPYTALLLFLQVPISRNHLTHLLLQYLSLEAPIFHFTMIISDSESCKVHFYWFPKENTHVLFCLLEVNTTLSQLPHLYTGNNTRLQGCCGGLITYRAFGGCADTQTLWKFLA